MDSTFVRPKCITEVSDALQVCFVVLFIVNQDAARVPSRHLKSLLRSLAVSSVGGCMAEEQNICGFTAYLLHELMRCKVRRIESGCIKEHR